MIIEVISAIGTVGAAAAAMVAAKWSRDSSESSLSLARTNLYFLIDEIFSRHFEVHMKLRPGGDWAGEEGPGSAVDWAAVEAYMGVFERIDMMIDEGLLEIATVNALYGYRYQNIVNNPVIRKAKLEGMELYWARFIQFGQKLAMAKTQSESVSLYSRN